MTGLTNQTTETVSDRIEKASKTGTTVKIKNLKDLSVLHAEMASAVMLKAHKVRFGAV